LPLRVAGVFLLGEGNPGEEPKCPSYEGAREHRGPAPLYVAGDQPKTPPHHSFSEIIRVPRVPPEAYLAEFAAASRRVAQEASELGI